jgi:hypothetical protein
MLARYLAGSQRYKQNCQEDQPRIETPNHQRVYSLSQNSGRLIIPSSLSKKCFGLSFPAKLGIAHRRKAKNKERFLVAALPGMIR